ncbi:MAG: hypothetical protein COW08_01865 [Ignavibacteriales bacterium CG12_big_fil_rev_8_21_14_0_65_30_8]|nr:MAG: hypothetical protein COW08_01865 [Ignavibacteriales bacterium CG12_big_fil_rev_8_21_14_0_65_30_8]
MILTMGAMIFLSAIVLRVNTVTLINTDTQYNSKFDILATSIGNTMIEEISKKAFDENSLSSTLTKTNELTNKNQLGPDGETYSQFDDIDDYDGYSYSDSTLPSAIFDVVCSVDYVKDTEPDKIDNQRQWTKKITVMVSSKSMEDVVTVSTLYSYWVFR